MRLQPLYDLQQEINRLFIAGSKFAKGDLRLQRQIPVFKKLGEKAPVFTKIATDMEELIQTDTRQSAEKLMALSALLYSILYTQGETVDTDAELRDQEPLIALDDVNTGFSYLQLRPVILALSTSNQGRLEVLKDARKRGLFSDSRTFQYLDLALADKYGELADYVEKIIIPDVGKPMLPFLHQSFQYVDKTEHVRRLRILEKLSSAEIPQMTERILSGSLPLLQAETVLILAKDPANEELIMKLAGDKNKLVREAAYNALAKLDTKNALERLKDLYIQAKDKVQQLPAIVSALAASKLPYFFDEIFEQVNDTFEAFISLDKKTDDKVLAGAFEKFTIMLRVLCGKTMPQVDEFYVHILSNRPFFELLKAKKTLLSAQVSNMMRSISQSLEERGNEEAVRFYDMHMDRIIQSEWNDILWSSYFSMTECLKWPKEKIYDRFYPAYKKGNLQIISLFFVFTENKYYNYYTNNEDWVVYVDRIDKRWIDVMYDVFDGKQKWDSYHHQALILLDACEEPASKKFNKLLQSILKYTQISVQINIFRYLMKRSLSDKFDIIYSTLEKQPKNTDNTYWLKQLSGTGFWTQFPEKYAEKFRKLGEKNKQDIYITIAEEMDSNKR